MRTAVHITWHGEGYLPGSEEVTNLVGRDADPALLVAGQVTLDQLLHQLTRRVVLHASLHCRQGGKRFFIRATLKGSTGQIRSARTATKLQFMYFQKRKMRVLSPNFLSFFFLFIYSRSLEKCYNFFSLKKHGYQIAQIKRHTITKVTYYSTIIFIFPGSVQILSCSRISIDRENIENAHRHMNVEIGNICFKFSVLCLCNARLVLFDRSIWWHSSL